MRYERQVFDRYFTPQEERQLLGTVGAYSNAPARRDHAWMRLLRQTGIRVQSAAGLTVGDAQRALRGGYLDVCSDHAKGGRGYRVYCNRRAAQALRDLLRIRADMGHAPVDSAPLIMSRNRRGMSVRSFQARLQHWCRTAGVREASPHWLRHTLAKRIMARSVARDPRGVVQSVLNHASVDSTAVYTMPDREDVELAMEGAQ